MKEQIIEQQPIGTAVKLQEEFQKRPMSPGEFERQALAQAKSLRAARPANAIGGLKPSSYGKIEN